MGHGDFKARASLKAFNYRQKLSFVVLIKSYACRFAIGVLQIDRYLLKSKHGPFA